MIHVLLCGGEPVLEEGLLAAFSGVEGFILASCSGPSDLPAALAEHRPDIVLMDTPAEPGPGAIAILRYAACSTLIVLWMRSASPDFAFRAISLGVRGVLLKTASIGTLMRCLTRVSEGELWFDKTLVADGTSPRKSALTARETELIRLLAQGMKNKEIAAAMSVSEGTVKVYLTRVFDKLGVKDRLALAQYGLSNSIGSSC